MEEADFFSRPSISSVGSQHNNSSLLCPSCFALADTTLIFQALTTGSSFQQVVKAGLQDLLRALQAELPEAEAETTV